jgi:hypothetical protein
MHIGLCGRLAMRGEGSGCLPYAYAQVTHGSYLYRPYSTEDSKVSPALAAAGNNPSLHLDSTSSRCKKSTTKKPWKM